MKYVLLFLLLPVIGNGQVTQKTDTLLIGSGKGIDTLTYPGTVIAGDSLQWHFLDVSPAPRDTVRVLLLVTDTVNWVTWSFVAYSVRIQHRDYGYGLNNYSYGFNMINEYWEHLYFIDKNRRKLLARYVVWQVKDL